MKKDQNTKTASDSDLSASAGSSSIYPQPVECNDGIKRWTETRGGMTLREYYAGQALAGIMAGDTWSEVPVDKDVAQYCVNVSDALCAKLSEKNSKAHSIRPNLNQQ